VDKERRGPVIFVVDDDESVRKALKRLINSAGMEAEVFGSVKDFLRSGCQGKPGCLVVDVHMLGGTGFDLKRHLDACGSSMPVIFVTAHDNPETKVRAEEVGAAAYIRKPFDEQALLDAISAALGKGR